MEKNDLMDKIISLCKRRGFVFPGSEIYGGLAIVGITARLDTYLNKTSKKRVEIFCSGKRGYVRWIRRIL